MTYTCPECDESLDAYYADNGIIVVCDTCGLEETVAPAGSKDEVYQEVCTRHDENRTHERGEGFQDGAVAVEGTKSYEEVDRMIGDASPPVEVRRSLRSRRVYLASYKLLPKEMPGAGAGVGSMNLDERVVARMRRGGISSFYAYQSKAIEQILQGKSVVIEAPTAFGKTEAFLVPIVHLASQMKGRGIRAIFVYPTKALGRDQLPKIASLAVAAGMRVKVFDGDTDWPDRKAIFNDPPELLVTNFDLLHHQMFRQGLLAEMLRTVRFLVVDETHVYTGVFGSNVHHVIARMRRLSGPLQCIAASATLSDSGRFCSELFGQEMTVVTESGRRAEVDYAIMRSAEIPKLRLVVNLIKRMTRVKRKTMAFSNSHRNVERVGAEARGKVDIGIHRGGINAERLRDTEAKFRTDILDAISCTPTMELGVDIGGVDCVISETIPYKRFMQRIGRAGRSGQRGCALLVLGDDPISQYYVDNPDDYERDEAVPYIDASNSYVAEHQMAAMASDRPITLAEEVGREETIADCINSGLLERRGGVLCITNSERDKLKREYSIRGSGESVDIYRNGKKVGFREMPVALTELHDGAIYMMEGRAYTVIQMRRSRESRADIERRSTGLKEHTRALSEDWPYVKRVIEKRRCFGAVVEYCALRIQKVVHGYLILDGDGKVIRGVKLERSLSYTFETKGIRFCVPRPADTIRRLGVDSIATDAFHAAGHVIIEGSRMITGASPADFGGMSMGSSGLIYVYDNTVGGSGASKTLYERMERAVERSRDIVGRCPCKKVNGCPHCTLSYKCGNNNERLHKVGALESLRRMIEGEETSIREADSEQKPIV